MRLDPYKRAKSRQYKAKHGLIDTRKATKQDLALPSNISDEKLSLDLESDDQDEICLNFDEMTLSFDSNKILDTSKYKYPKDLYEKLFEFEVKSSDKITSSSPISKHLSHILALPECYFYGENARIIINNENFNEINHKTENLTQLKLQRDECNFKEKSPIDKVNPKKDDKLELEEWLDQIL